MIVELRRRTVAGVRPADYFFEPVLSAFSTSAGSTPEMTPSDSAASSAAAGTDGLSAESGTACAAAWKPIFE
jgi:hypothetical protein